MTEEQLKTITTTIFYKPELVQHVLIYLLEI